MKSLSLFTVIVFLLGILIFSGCASPGPAPSPTANQAPPPTQSQSAAPKSPASSEKPASAPANLPSTIGVATHQSGTAAYAWGIAFADVVSKHTSMKMISQPTPGPNAWAPLMRKGEVQFGIANQFDSFDMYFGRGVFNEKTDVRCVKIGYNVIQTTLITLADSGIKNITDVKGKRVAYGCPAMKSLDINTEAYLATGGLTIKDIVAVPYTGMAQAQDLLLQGRIDACTTAIGAPVAKEIDASPHGVRYVNLNPKPEPQWLKIINDLDPGIEFTTVKPPEVGVKEPITVLTYSNYLVAYANVPDEVVYQVAKTLDQYYDEYKGSHPQFDTWAPGLSSRPATVPYHPGAVKFYKEKGLWTADNEKKQAEFQK